MQTARGHRFTWLPPRLFDRLSFFLISARVDWKSFLPMLTLGKSVVNLTLREITRLTQLNSNQLWRELERMHNVNGTTGPSLFSPRLYLLLASSISGIELESTRVRSVGFQKSVGVSVTSRPIDRTGHGRIDPIISGLYWISIGQ